jgi:hypothetical protein
MIVSLFKPFPEEHLYSWLVRLYKLSGSADFLSFQKALGFQERFLSSNILFSEASDALALRLRDRNNALFEHTSALLWQVSVGSLVGEAFSRLDSFNHMNEQLLFSFDTSWHSCKRCREEDLEQYGTTYWHVQHQLPSIFECYKHQSILEFANEPVKNLFTCELPHDIEAWCPLIISPSGELHRWQSFLFGISELSKHKSVELINLQQKITKVLFLNEIRASKRRAICQKLNPHFVATLGDELIQFLFRDYSRPKQRSNTNILTSMFAKTHKIQGERNPIFWVALAYWLKDELGLNNAPFIS